MQHRRVTRLAVYRLIQPLLRLKLIHYLQHQLFLPTLLPSYVRETRATLRVDGPYTVFWSTGDSTQRITTGTAGTYSARVRDVNGCRSYRQAPLRWNKTAPSSANINIIGTYTLEAVSSTNGTQFRWYRGTDSLAAQSAIIKANQSGLYTARSSTVYSPTLTCFSHPSAPITFTIDLTIEGWVFIQIQIRIKL